MGQGPVDPSAASPFGLEIPTAAPQQHGPLELLASPLRAQSVEEMLRYVIDPELGVNIVDLGLLRSVEIGEDGVVSIEMTLTTPGCPLGDYIDDEIRASMAQLPQVRGVEVKLTFEPAWDPTQMTDAGREQLGWL